MTDLVINMMGPAYGASSSESPSASTEVGTSLEGHCSGESQTSTEPEEFYTPKSESEGQARGFSPPSTSTSTPLSDSHSENEKKESFTFLTELGRHYWQKTIFRVFNERLEEEDKRGLIAPIPESQLIETLELDLPLRMKEDMEEIMKALVMSPWPKDDRTYPYRQIRQLLRKHRRNLDTDDDFQLE